MPSIKVLIIEDELLLSEQLANQLAQLGFEVIGQLDNGEEVSEFMANAIPDIVLMDIHLAGNMDGIEAAAQLKIKHDLPIIYLTEYTDKVTYERARQTGPVNFIPKPFNISELERAIDLALLRTSYKKRTRGEAYDENHHHYFLKDAFFVKDKNTYRKIDFSEVIYLQADRSYSKIKTETRTFTFSVSLNKLAEQITHKHLVRISRSNIVNINKISRIEGNTIFLIQAKEEVPILIGKTYREDFFRLMPIVK